MRVLLNPRTTIVFLFSNSIDCKSTFFPGKVKDAAPWQTWITEEERMIEWSRESLEATIFVKMGFEGLKNVRARKGGCKERRVPAPRSYGKRRIGEWSGLTLLHFNREMMLEAGELRSTHKADLRRNWTSDSLFPVCGQSEVLHLLKSLKLKKIFTKCNSVTYTKQRCIQLF